LQKKKLIPETHKTIPIIFKDGKFIGGYTDLVNTLKLEGKASDEILEIVTQKAGESHVDFEKNATHATLSMAAASWITTDEYIISKEDNASLQISLNIKNLKNQKVTLYLVAEPPNDEGLVRTRQAQLEGVGEGKGVAVFREGVVEVGEEKVKIEENRFARKRVACEIRGEIVEIAIPFPDRHLVKEVVLEGVDGDESGYAEGHFVFEKDVKLYVVYITTEPPKK